MSRSAFARRQRRASDWGSWHVLVLALPHTPAGEETFMADPIPKMTVREAAEMLGV